MALLASISLRDLGLGVLWIENCTLAMVSTFYAKIIPVNGEKQRKCL
jgi:hypothetical protein